MTVERSFSLLGVPYLQEILHPLRIIAVALPTDPFHLLDLASLASRLDVLKMNFWILAEVHNGAQEVEQTCKTGTTKRK